MNEKDRIKQDKQMKEFEILENDKKQLNKYIDFYFSNWPKLDLPLKRYKPQELFSRMQDQLDDLLYKFQEEVEKL